MAPPPIEFAGNGGTFSNGTAGGLHPEAGTEPSPKEADEYDLETTV